MYYKRHVSVDWYPFIELNVIRGVWQKSHSMLSIYHSWFWWIVYQETRIHWRVRVHKAIKSLKTLYIAFSCHLLARNKFELLQSLNGNSQQNRNVFNLKFELVIKKSVIFFPLNRKKKKKSQKAHIRLKETNIKYISWFRQKQQELDKDRSWSRLGVALRYNCIQI